VFGIRGEFLRTELMLGSGDGWGLELGQGWGQVRKADVRDGDFRGGQVYGNKYQYFTGPELASGGDGVAYSDVDTTRRPITDVWLLSR